MCVSFKCKPALHGHRSVQCALSSNSSHPSLMDVGWVSASLKNTLTTQTNTHNQKFTFTYTNKNTEIHRCSLWHKYTNKYTHLITNILICSKYTLQIHCHINTLTHVHTYIHKYTKTAQKYTHDHINILIAHRYTHKYTQSHKYVLCTWNTNANMSTNINTKNIKLELNHTHLSSGPQVCWSPTICAPWFLCTVGPTVFSVSIFTSMPPPVYLALLCVFLPKRIMSHFNHTEKKLLWPPGRPSKEGGLDFSIAPAKEQRSHRCELAVFYPCVAEQEGRPCHTFYMSLMVAQGCPLHWLQSHLPLGGPGTICALQYVKPKTLQTI